MQTFLPYASFVNSVKCLDYKRLGNQRNEARILLRSLRGGGGWDHHPASHMWRGYEIALSWYGDIVIHEWMRRGYENNMPILCEWMAKDVIRPPWLGNSAFHASHRSNLLRKKPEWYVQFGWVEPDNLPLVWPK